MPRTPRKPAESSDALARYAGRWVALLGNRVVGQGGTPEQAYQAARQLRFKEIPQVKYIPASQPFSFHSLLASVAQGFPADVPVYLVGGAVRDALRGRIAHDLDFVLVGDVMALARRLGDQIGAAYYPLDEKRQYARLVLQVPAEGRFMLDFAPLEGEDLESDLRARDFTINAIAVDLRDQRALLDPLGGAADLAAKRLRACSPDAFLADPLRILRAVRLAAAFDLRILPDTLRLMRQAVRGLEGISPERLRDELFRILDGSRPTTALRALEMMGVFPYVLPELPPLQGVKQSPPHILDVWEHTLDVIKRLEAILEVLAPAYDPDKAASLILGLVVLRLGRYRQQIQAHLSESLNPNRTLRSLLFFAALYHDVGKPETRTQQPDGRVRFFEHDQLGQILTSTRAQALHLSNVEIERLKVIVRHHMRPLLLAQMDELPSRRAIYRYFRDTGPAGVDICLLSLADTLGTYGASLPQEVWARQLDVIRLLLEAWWEKPSENIAPPPLLNGRDLIEQLGLQPGPLIGQLLEAIREAQASGQVTTPEQAIALAERLQGDCSGELVEPDQG